MIASRIPDPETPPTSSWAPPTEPPLPPVQLFARNGGPFGEHELVLSPGASASDVSAALVLIPHDAVLVEFGGDIDVELVFREVPRPQPDAEARLVEDLPAAATG